MKNNIEKKSGKVHECTGCQICSAVCPTNVINIELDEEGFYQAIVNNELCTNCGTCTRFCYKYDKNIQITNDNSKLKVYAATTKNHEILKASTSGGISSHLISVCLEQGYNVVGVSYDYYDNIAITKIVDSIGEAKKFRGSKYMQSSPEKAFRQIVVDNKEQKYAVFGTPCQIYALNKWATHNGRRKQFLFIDLFCHGCPSMILWKRYIEHIKPKMRDLKFTRIEFRSKAYGWHEYCHKFYYKDGIVISERSTLDPFFAIFFDNYILNKSCYKCQVRSSFSYADIRLGDFWGSRYELNVKGVSAVVCCTEIGIKLFNQIKEVLNFSSADINEVLKEQSYGKEYECDQHIRNNVINLLKSKGRMNDLLYQYMRVIPLKTKCKKIIKTIIEKLPKKTVLKLKKAYHSKRG